MTSPIGKILLAKLPKDIVQFCIEPMLMISEEEVRQNYKRVLNTLTKFDLFFLQSILASRSISRNSKRRREYMNQMSDDELEEIHQFIMGNRDEMPRITNKHITW